MLGIPTGLEASNENLLQTQSNGQNHAENHSEKNMLNLEMVGGEFEEIFIFDYNDSIFKTGESHQQQNITAAEQIIQVSLFTTSRIT